MNKSTEVLQAPIDEQDPKTVAAIAPEVGSAVLAGLIATNPSIARILSAAEGTQPAFQSA